MASCKFFAQGHCMRGDGCRYEHGTAAKHAFHARSITNNHTHGQSVFAASRSNGKVLNNEPDHAQPHDFRSKIPCVHYARGNCKNGDWCLFLHPTTTDEHSLASLQKEEDSRPQIPCHHFIRGHCKSGKACRYLHPEVADPQEELSADDEEKLDFDNFNREFCGTLARFGVGAKVLKISFSSDFSAVRINGLPEGTTRKAVLLLMSRLNLEIEEDCIRLSRHVGINPICANIKVEDPEFGKMVCSQFAHRESLDPELSCLEVMQLPSSLPTGTNASRLECRKVQCSWFKPSRIARLSFGNEDIAQRVFEKFTSKKYKIHQKPVQCSAPTGGGTFRGHGRRSMLTWTIMLTELPVKTTEQDIRDVLRAPNDKPRNVSLGEPSYEAEGELATASVMSLLSHFGRIEWSQTNTELEGKRAKAVARFYEETDAREAARSLDRKPLDFCKSMTLNAQLISTAKFKVATNIFAAVQGRIRSVSQIWKDQHLNFKVYPIAGQGQQYRILRIEGQVAEDVTAAKTIMDEILDGVTVKRDGLPIWTPALNNNGSIFKKLKKIQEELAVIVTRNKTKCVLQVFGSPENVANAVAAISTTIDSESSSAMEILLKPDEFNWACNGGFKKIADSLGDKIATFDIVSSPKRILIVGSTTDYESALRMVENRTVEIQLREAGAEDCSVCWTKAENAVVTKCKHVYCLECFEGLCTAAGSTGKDFSIVCYGDMGKCEVVFSLEELQEHLSSKAFEETLEASFTSHIQRNPAIYSYCPKPDCGTIYRATATAGFSTCSKCLTVTCTSCRVAHEGKTCAEYKDEASGGYEATQKLKKKLGIKDCPNCGIGLEKTEGCNHMTCSCGAHVCWVCLEVFKEAKPCYDHMFAKHRGIGLGPGGV